MLSCIKTVNQNYHIDKINWVDSNNKFIGFDTTINSPNPYYGYKYFKKIEEINFEALEQEKNNEELLYLIEYAPKDIENNLYFGRFLGIVHDSKIDQLHYIIISIMKNNLEKPYGYLILYNYHQGLYWHNIYGCIDKEINTYI
ncbi:hypothetical protein [Brachyspira hyodysenteriae]|uniref:hypothetical protein n=1 Tax=Brachyspira hyodysenteriae TaxID=159 RepID=UPI00063D9C5C|nr:hypothetical protein [Brachyspira hyodysenteriae]KLI46131.1 hypothetical protein SZ41_12240 [Brachyspira hyodysenteriae]KLI53628.1 hypothetical protein SZ42_00625 [Brachyspira hyodysenteriae]MCZ9888988.1 hypothetical protein [Brachyspira hyodysenteriae]